MFIIPLHSDQAVLALVGGKGANLAKLVRAGFPVPGGFLITTEAYRAFVAANELESRIAALWQNVQVDNPSQLTAVSEQIRALFQAGHIPDELRQEALAAYTALGDNPAVAVRSSATAEDLPDLSFAGQQDTYLNIVGPEELLKAVISCWGSLWTARAIGYRARNAIPQDEVALSVVVQIMVPSEASGVMFTVNPLNGKRSETVIDATLGLGEALVSGQVEPDHYIVETASGRIVSKFLGAKALAIHGQAGGGTTTVHEDASQTQAIPDEVIAELVALGQKVAYLFGTPQDLEWGWANGRLFLLQSRPITSLYPLPPQAEQAEDLKVMISFGAVQGVLDPLTPLGQDTIRTMVKGGARVFGTTDLTLNSQNVMWIAGERIFINVTAIVRHPFGRTVIQNALKAIEPTVQQALVSLLDDPRLAVLPDQPSATTQGAVARFALRTLPHMWRGARDPDLQRAVIKNKISNLIFQWQREIALAKTLPETLAIYDRLFQDVFPDVFATLMPGVLIGLASLGIAQSISAKIPNAPDYLTLTRGLPHNVTTEMDMFLWETAQAIRRDAAAYAYFQEHAADDLAKAYQAQQLPPAGQTAVANFLKKYGMRGVAEIDFGRPRWNDDPTHIVQVLKSYLQITDESKAPTAVFARGAQEAEKAAQEMIAAVRQSPDGEGKARIMATLIHHYRALAGLRESPKFVFINLIALLRASMQKQGAKLVTDGVLKEADDIFFLYIADLEQIAAQKEPDPRWQTLVAERRQRFERERQRRQIPRLLLSDGHAFYEGVATPIGEEKEGVLVGSPVSPGVVEGVVHVVFEPHNAELAPGEILVCPGTDPAWTPLFLAAGGLVMEVGGLMTHGSVVAREYGIPAVVGVHQATTRLQTGQRVRVDGSAGTITLLDSDKELDAAGDN